ncbi:hypothetical protein GIB67_025339 [Kingdonia uniflora]|uniref:Mitogen-activated protein kinase kinase kinase 1 n=1 Tax=Kingdonia uniflora TaxID=39325 RepID=A0A7J7NBN9_9MAGN|nr:hypothetical protein GIB67_025339 [Kingdonia uniflora]
MDSVGSNSPEPHQESHRRYKPSQSVTDRIIRAFRHRLRLLHHSESIFFVLGATGNVYTVTLTNTPSCNCPDRKKPCKHILFVFLRVLGVPFDDICLRRRTLRPCQLNRLLLSPVSLETLAGARARTRFHQLFSQLAAGPPPANIEVEDGAVCPICLDEITKDDGVVACAACGNPLHEECFLKWKRSKGRRSANCVMCRARWKDRQDQERYLNLAAYISDDDNNDTVNMCRGS